MKKEEIKECVDYWFDKSKQLLALQHEYCLAQIRLETANKRKLEEYKAYSMQEYARRKNENR